MFRVNLIYGRLVGGRGAGGGGEMQMFPESHSLPVVTEGLISECVVAWSDCSMWVIVSLPNILFVIVMLQTKEG